MVAPDYQEFANRRTSDSRDNTVICGVRTSGRCRNQPAVARLPRCQTSTKAELSAHTRAERRRWRPELPGTRVVNADARNVIPCNYRAFAAGSSVRLSITLSTI